MSTLESIGEKPSADPILNAPVIGFGYDEQKLHKTLIDVLRGNEARIFKQRAEAMPRDDPEPRYHCVQGIALSLIGSL